MLPQSIRDTFLDLEPETLRRLEEERPDDDGPMNMTRVMSEKHGAKSSVHAVVKARVVPSPFPKSAAAAPMKIRPQMSSEPTWLRPVQNTALPTAPAKPFEDFDFSEFEEDEAPSDQMPVVHGVRARTLAERLANPMSPEDAQLCWDHAQAMAAAQQQMAAVQQAQEFEEPFPSMPMQLDVRPNYQPMESGIRPVTVVPKARSSRRVSYARAFSSFVMALVLGATAMAGWRGDITAKNVHTAGLRAQITAAHALQALKK